jgi:hypothetical protein
LTKKRINLIKELNTRAFMRKWGNNMNKKILLGSIIALCILIGVSITSVVGYRSIVSDVKVSPLFSIRTSRAIDEEREDLSCEYVGKGNDISINFPGSNSRNTQLQKVIEVINTMDDDTFNRFVNFLINRQVKGIKEENIPNLLKALYWLNRNPDKLHNFYTNKIENRYYTEEGFCKTVGFIWVPGCLIAFIMGYLIWLVLSFVTIIWDCV